MPGGLLALALQNHLTAACRAELARTLEFIRCVVEWAEFTGFR